MVLAANTIAMNTITATPKRLAAKKAGMPSTMGDEPRISSRAVLAVVLCSWAWSGGVVSVVGVTLCAVPAS